MWLGLYDSISTFQSRRKSEPKSDEKSVEKPPQINRENTPIPIGKRNGAEYKTYHILPNNHTCSFKGTSFTHFMNF